MVKIIFSCSPTCGCTLCFVCWYYPPWDKCVCFTKHNGQGQWPFWLFLLLSVVSLCLLCPCAPSTPVSTLGHLLGSAAWAWGWLALWWQVAAGHRAKHSIKEESTRKWQKERQKALQMWWNSSTDRWLCYIVVSFHYRVELPSQYSHFSVCHNISLDLFFIPSQ